VDDVTRRRLGDANPNGRLERPQGRFRLAYGLDDPGAIAAPVALELVEADWKRQAAIGNVSEVVLDGYCRDARSLVRTAQARGLRNLGEIDQDLIWTWMRSAKVDEPEASVSSNTRYRRRSAARAFFMTAQCLGLYDQNPAMSVEESGRSVRYVNAFTDAEIEQVKRVAAYRLGETRHPAALALVLSGATNGEVAYGVVDDVDLIHRRVWCHNGGKRSRDRWIPLDDDWCFQALANRVAALSRVTDGDVALGQRPLTYTRITAGDAFAKRSAATSMLLLKLLKKARVWRPGETRAESLREWLAAKIFAETGRVEAVAARLGMSSLDAAAHLVGYDWTGEFDIDAPPVRRGEH
jgi:integrase/recombinase XerC